MALPEKEPAEALEDLRLDYGERCGELVQVHAELCAAKLEVQQLDARLQAAGASGASVIPAGLRAGRDSIDPSRVAVRKLLKWLSECVVLGPPAIFDAETVAHVGGRDVHLRRVAQWCLSCPGGLKLSVPPDVAEDMMAMLTAAREHGDVQDHEVARLTQVWELMSSEHATEKNPEPIFLLAHRKTSEGILVATWPNRPRPLRCRRNQPPSSSCPPRLGRNVEEGDRVEVKFQGAWFAGAVAILDGPVAHVQCDVDPHLVYTASPVDSLRVLRDPSLAASLRFN